MNDAKFLVDVNTALPAEGGTNCFDLKPTTAFLPATLDAVLEAAVRIIIDVVVLMVYAMRPIVGTVQVAACAEL